MGKTTVEAKICPKCGKEMVQNLTFVLMSNPPVDVGTWWCGCGHQEPLRQRRLGTQEMLRKEWERINKERGTNEQGYS
jgi:hypothetical protein